VKEGFNVLPTSTPIPCWRTIAGHRRHVMRSGPPIGSNRGSNARADEIIIEQAFVPVVVMRDFGRQYAAEAMEMGADQCS